MCVCVYAKRALLCRQLAEQTDALMAERERATRASEKLKEESAQRVKCERELEDQKVCRIEHVTDCISLIAYN